MGNNIGFELVLQDCDDTLFGIVNLVELSIEAGCIQTKRIGEVQFGAVIDEMGGATIQPNDGRWFAPWSRSACRMITPKATEVDTGITMIIEQDDLEDMSAIEVYCKLLRRCGYKQVIIDQQSTHRAVTVHSGPLVVPEFITSSKPSWPVQ